MRAALVLMSTLAGACSMAPGAPFTDITATNTEQTGPYEIVERQVVDGDRYLLRVEAEHPERARLIADRVIYQVLPRSPAEVIVEVYARAGGAESRPAERIAWRRPADVSGVSVPTPRSGPSAADRQVDRPEPGDH